jgi:hypothetical protein
MMDIGYFNVVEFVVLKKKKKKKKKHLQITMVGMRWGWISYNLFLYMLL